ncbi:MAG TPA: hypothetical protein DIT89_06350 [Planctomycetaceae bacterium]|nr:hypothetical protein [Planctomycetaceae bacterium]
MQTLRVLDWNPKRSFRLSSGSWLVSDRNRHHRLRRQILQRILLTLVDYFLWFVRWFQEWNLQKFIPCCAGLTGTVSSGQKLTSEKLRSVIPIGEGTDLFWGSDGG